MKKFFLFVSLLLFSKIAFGFSYGFTPEKFEFDIVIYKDGNISTSFEVYVVMLDVLKQSKISGEKQIAPQDKNYIQDQVEYLKLNYKKYFPEQNIKIECVDSCVTARFKMHGVWTYSFKDIALLTDKLTHIDRSDEHSLFPVQVGKSSSNDNTLIFFSNIPFIQPNLFLTTMLQKIYGLEMYGRVSIKIPKLCEVIAHNAHNNIQNNIQNKENIVLKWEWGTNFFLDIAKLEEVDVIVKCSHF